MLGSQVVLTSGSCRGEVPRLAGELTEQMSELGLLGFVQGIEDLALGGGHRLLDLLDTGLSSVRC